MGIYRYRWHEGESQRQPARIACGLLRYPKGVVSSAAERNAVRLSRGCIPSRGQAAEVERMWYHSHHERPHGLLLKSKRCSPSPPAPSRFEKEKMMPS